VTQLVLDAGVWVAANDVDDAHVGPAADLIRRASLGELSVVALDVTLYEVVNVALMRWRSPRDAELLVELVETIATIDRVGGDLAHAAIDGAERYGLTAYDAAYVAAARRRGATLVSTDLAGLVRPGLAVAPDAV
jgi:predicted nucleic acid-binding protein